MKIPCKVTLSGDKDYARNFIGAAQSQLRILESQMTFQDLKQGMRLTRLNPRTTVESNVCFDLREVKIYSESLVIEMKEEEGLEKLIPRFFAYIVKVDDITGELSRDYKWIYFVEAGSDMSEYEQTQHLSPISMNSDYDVYVWGTKNSILETMKNTPRGPDHTHKHPHRHTKAFMMDDRAPAIVDAAIAAGEDLKLNRFVSACHILTKNREIMFMPLHAYIGHGVPKLNEICDIFDSAKYPMYPLPYSSTYYLAYANKIFFTGLNFPCPPRRFYCNTDEGIMVWYTTNSTIVEAQNFICGIIYDIRNQSFRTFIHYPSDANGLGFTAYWAIDTTNAELPTPLMFDVQTLDGDGMDVAIAWSKRPINCHTKFLDSSITYSELSICNHIRWTGINTGFKVEPFAAFEQCTANVTTEDDDYIIDLSGVIPPCAVVGGGCSRTYFEYYAKKEWWFGGAFNWYSLQQWDILGNDLDVRADKRQLTTIQQNTESISLCLAPACNDNRYTYTKIRMVQDNISQQITETYTGRWLCPNAVYLFKEKHKKYCLADAKIYMEDAYFADAPGFTPTEDQFNETMDEWRGMVAGSPPYTYFSYPSFCHLHNDTMPDDWIQVDTDVKTSGLVMGTWQHNWERTTNVDTSTEDNPGQYQVDENLYFDVGDVDHIYYLDDRATENNQGLVAAGKGDSVTELYTDDCLGAIEYKPDYWKVMWKVCWDNEDLGIVCADIADEDIPYIDITEKLLEALDCEDHELIDLGLI